MLYHVEWVMSFQAEMFSFYVRLIHFPLFLLFLHFSPEKLPFVNRERALKVRSVRRKVTTLIAQSNLRSKSNGSMGPAVLTSDQERTAVCKTDWLNKNDIFRARNWLFVSSAVFIGDSFVVNACLARKGIDDWIIKQKYYCTGSHIEQRDGQQKTICDLSTRVSINGFVCVYTWAASALTILQLG